MALACSSGIWWCTLPSHSPSVTTTAATATQQQAVYDMAGMQVSMDEIDLAEQIGKGGFGAVYKGTWRGAPVAVKYAVCNVQDVDSIEGAIREVVLSKKMSHPHVVRTLGCLALCICHDLIFNGGCVMLPWPIGNVIGGVSFTDARSRQAASACANWNLGM